MVSSCSTRTSKAATSLLTVKPPKSVRSAVRDGVAGCVGAGGGGDMLDAGNGSGLRCGLGSNVGDGIVGTGGDGSVGVSGSSPAKINLDLPEPGASPRAVEMSGGVRAALDSAPLVGEDDEGRFLRVDGLGTFPLRATMTGWGPLVPESVTGFAISLVVTVST